MTSWREFRDRQKIASFGDTFIRYISEGSGVPLVLLHGIPTWSYLWLPVIDPLAEVAHVLAPDLPGFGFSDKRDRFDRSIARQAEFVDGWMEHLGITSAVVVGHDIGGGVAQRLATYYPSRVRKLCLINSVCYDSWPVELMIQLGHPQVHRLLSAGMLTRILKPALRAGCASRPPSAFLDGLLAPYSTEEGKLSLIRDASALNTNLTMEIVPRLSSIRVPALILWGEDDIFQPITYGERLADDLPHASFVRLGGARHFAMIDRPRAVASRIAAFASAEP